MKKSLVLILAVIACVVMCIPAAAVTPVDGIEHCYYNYICNKSVNAVTADGVYNEDEWSDAVELVINKDTLEDFGRWQCTGDPLPASEFSCTYKFKWDEKYFYVLEIRTDAHYVSAFGDNSYDALTPWMMDGTAIFFCDNELPDSSNRCDIKFYSYVDELKGPSVYIGNGGEVADAFTGPSGESDCTYGGSVNGTTIVFELKMPWSIMEDQWHLDSEIKEGTVFRFTPIIMTRDTIDDYALWDGSSYRQMNFHDCVNIPEEGVTGAEDPNYWAALTLSAAGAGSSTPAAAEATAVDEAPATEEAAGPEYRDYTSTDVIAANSGAGYETLDEAAASIGKTPINAYSFISGTGSFNNEGPENLWDNDTATKFCSGEFPTISVAKLDAPATIDGVIMATANDTATHEGRNPFEWAIFVSADGSNWTQLVYGDDSFFEATNFTYYAAAVTPVENVQYVQFQSEGGLEGCFQLSELVLCGTAGEAAPVAEAPAEEAPAAEAPVEEAPAAEEPAAEEPETVEAPAAETPVEEAPQTFDMGIIAAAAAVVSLAGYAVAKKH